MDKLIEQYKSLIEIYYHEVNLFYTKANNFMTLQLALLGGIAAGFDKLIELPGVFRIGLGVLILITLIQLLIYKRGYDVLNATISTILRYERNYGFELVSEFNKSMAERKNAKFRIRKMNFPSFAVIIINAVFLLSWILLWVYFELEYDGIKSVLNTQ